MPDYLLGSNTRRAYGDLQVSLSCTQAPTLVVVVSYWDRGVKKVVDSFVMAGAAHAANSSAEAKTDAEKKDDGAAATAGAGGGEPKQQRLKDTLKAALLGEKVTSRPKLPLVSLLLLSSNN